MISFIPCICAIGVSSFILKMYPLTSLNIIMGFSSFSAIHLMSYFADRNYIQKGFAPKWYSKFRMQVMILHMLLTLGLGTAFYTWRSDC